MTLLEILAVLSPCLFGAMGLLIYRYQDRSEQQSGLPTRPARTPAE